MQDVRAACAVFALLFGAAVACQGQAGSARAGRITGLIRDSATGAPVVRGFVCGEIPAFDSNQPRVRCGTTGDSGRFRIDSVPPGEYQMAATCAGGTLFAGSTLGTRKVTVLSGATTIWSIDASVARCDQRPMERLTGRFVGLYYNPDFETSWFFPDGRTNLHADTDFSHSGPWPDVFQSLPKVIYGLGCVRVTFAGKMHGPLYNNRSEMVYVTDVDTIVSARPVSLSECVKVVQRILPWIKE